MIQEQKREIRINLKLLTAERVLTYLHISMEPVDFGCILDWGFGTHAYLLCIDWEPLIMSSRRGY